MVLILTGVIITVQIKLVTLCRNVWWSVQKFENVMYHGKTLITGFALIRPMPLGQAENIVGIHITTQHAK